MPGEVLGGGLVGGSIFVHAPFRQVQVSAAADPGGGGPPDAVYAADEYKVPKRTMSCWASS